MQGEAAQRVSSAKPLRECSNCGAELKGAYCHVCGQPGRHFIQALPGLIREIAGETLYYDSRMWRTLKSLLFQPGHLSREYVHGRRARYTPPFRLYLVCSILAFLLVSVVINTADVSPWIASSELAEGETAASESAPVRGVGVAPDWDMKANPVVIAGLSDAGNLWINQQIERIVDNTTEVQRNPARLFRTAASMLPQTMFVLLPLFALLVGLFYLFSGRYYIEHLLLQVHNHAFLFLALIILYALATAQAALTGADVTGGGLMVAVLGLLSLFVWIWMLVYLWLSLKRFYDQGWLMTSAKFLMLGFAYSMLLTLGLASLLLLGLWRL